MQKFKLHKITTKIAEQDFARITYTGSKIACKVARKKIA